MTEDAKPGGPSRRPDQTDFDLVEDVGDAAAFDRALDDLLPRGDLGAGGRFEIDPADFEAFNRELDAQMAQAKARAAHVDIIEDLGTDVVAPPPGPRREPTPAVPERVGGGVDEPRVADDIVTLGGAATAAAAAPATKGPPHPETHDVPAPPAAATAAAPPAPVRRGATLALLLGLGGLVAGAAGLWLGLDRQTELARLRSALAERQPAAAVPAMATASAEAEKIRALEGRLEEVTRRLTELNTAPPAAETAPKTLPDAHAPPRERPSVAASPTTHQHPGAAVTQHTATPTETAPRPEPESRPAAKEPPPTAAIEQPAPPPQPPTPASTAAGPDSAATVAPAPQSPTLPAAASAQPAQALLKPSGDGPWSLVIDSFQDESVAEQRSAQIARMGLPAEVRWELVKDEVRYRVIVPGYATRDAADAAAAELRRRKAGGAWVTRLPKQE
jgi:DedD protein